MVRVVQALADDTSSRMTVAGDATGRATWNKIRGEWSLDDVFNRADLGRTEREEETSTCVQDRRRCPS